MNPICRQDLTEAKPILSPTCSGTQNLRIGQATAATAYDVYVYREGDGRLVKYDVTSDGSGNLDIDLTLYERFFNASNTFQLWAVADDGDIANVVTLSGQNGWIVTCVDGQPAPTLQTLQSI